MHGIWAGGEIFLLEVERPGPEADHSPRIRMRGAIAILPLYAGVDGGKFHSKAFLALWYLEIRNLAHVYSV
jgi:hypothetical protein